MINHDLGGISTSRNFLRHEVQNHSLLYLSIRIYPSDGFRLCSTPEPNRLMVSFTAIVVLALEMIAYRIVAATSLVLGKILVSFDITVLVYLTPFTTATATLVL